MKRQIQAAWWAVWALILLPAVTTYAQTDSLATDSAATPASFLKVSIGYTSKVLSYGRDYGIQQFALTPAIEYNHRSGLYAGISGSYLSEATQPYTATVLYGGYSNTFGGENWSYDFSYSHIFFHPDSNSIINNSLGAGVMYTKNWFMANANYTFLFGEEKAHQLTTGIGAYVEKSLKGFVETISCNPGITATFGTANVPLQNLPLSQYTRGTGETWQAFKERNATRRNRNGNLSEDQDGFSFGLMSWECSLPVNFFAGNFQCTLSYNYVIPVALPEEDASTLSSRGYLGARFAYTIRKKNHVSTH